MPDRFEPKAGSLQQRSDTVSSTPTICNTKGMHARAAAAFVKCAQVYDAEVLVTKDGQTVIGTSIMALLMLVAGKGTKLTIEAEGRQAAEAVKALTSLVDAGFNEDI